MTIQDALLLRVFDAHFGRRGYDRSRLLGLAENHPNEVCSSLTPRNCRNGLLPPKSRFIRASRRCEGVRMVTPEVRHAW